MSTEKIEVEYVLFNSPQRDIKQEYPELALIEEFKQLTAIEVRLCWLIGNQSSPIFKKPRQQKIQEALKTVYGMGRIEQDAKLKKFYEYKKQSDIPDKILAGIDRMVGFNLENRIKAKMLSQHSFDKMNELILGADTSTMDMDEKKKFVELMIKVNTELPKHISILESGFGVKLVNKKDGSEIKTDINKLDI